MDYEKIKGTYKVNDKIKITGFAKLMQEIILMAPLVKYRVDSQTQDFFIPGCFGDGWPSTDRAPMEIAHGEAKTDKDGKFIIEFEAIPDITLDKKFEPVFDYTVYADVTDINGETRSGETNSFCRL